MIIIHKNQGTKVDYRVEDNQLNIGNELILDLAEFEKDFQVDLDICLDKENILKLGIWEKYVAQISIPPRQYIYPKANNEEEGEPSKLALPFNMKKVSLTLWGMEE